MTTDTHTQALEALRLGLGAAEETLAERHQALAGYPHKWRAEQERVNTIRAALAAAEAQPAATLTVEQQHLLQDCDKGLTAALAGKPDALRHAREAAAAIAAEAQPSPTAGMNIAQRILHVGGRNNAAGYIEFGSIQAVEALVRHVLRDQQQPVAAPQRDQVDALALVLLEAWKKAEPDSSVTKYPMSYLATFADMARAALSAGAQTVAVAHFDWPDSAVLSVMNSVGDGPYGEEDMAVTRRFLRRAEEVRAELLAAAPAAPAPALVPLTNAQIDALSELAFDDFMRDGNDDYDRAFARAIERAHGIGGEA